jgi:glycosyltransferase involved in cell wall biosynthesis
MGGSGVQRPLKFVKYLKDYGWNPIVLCPEPGMYKIFDESLQKELEEISPDIYKVEGKTPFLLFGGKERTAQLVPEFISSLIRKTLRLFMFPDNKKGWIDPALEKARELINEHEIDLVFSTAPPFSNHLIGARLKEEFDLPLVLDYRDSWTQNQFFTELYDWQKKKMKQLERKSVSKADVIIGLDEITLKGIKEIHGTINSRFEIVEHGYDPQDFEIEVSPSLKYEVGKFNLLYSGTFVEHNQPDTFLKGIAAGIVEGQFSKQDFQLHFQGGLNKGIRSLISELDLEENVTEYSYLNHKEAVANLRKADALWVLENYDPELSQIKNGKLFEYFGAKKPILGVLNPGISENLINEYNAGYIADVQSPQNISRTFARMVIDWKSDNFKKPDLQFVDKHNRRLLTKKLADIFEEISNQQ